MKKGWVAPPSATTSAVRPAFASVRLVALLALLIAPEHAPAATPSPATGPVSEASAKVAPSGDEPAAFWIYLSDKGERDPAGLTRALREVEGRMTAAARERRAKGSSSEFRADVTDLSVHAPYLRRIERTGARVRHASRWLNAVSVDADRVALRALEALPFVARVAPVGKSIPMLLPPSSYGVSLPQNQMVGSVAAHDSGYSAAGIVIGILDTGFRKTHIAVAPLKVLAEWDFVQSDGETANQAGDDPTQWYHGTGVWSVLGGYLPGGLIGPAYNAKFVLAKTHDVGVSAKADEDHWIAGAEWADSIGIDILQSSMVINDPYAQLNGATTPLAVAANILKRHGVLVVTAMGNTGPNPGSLWTPSDCDSILAVGSVEPNGTISTFSARGPTFDGRGKPDVVAQGSNTIWANAAGNTNLGTYPGTSSAAPLVSGTAALVHEAHPEWTAQEVRYAIKSTATRAATPDSTTYGWGVPQAVAAIYNSTLGPPIYPKPFWLVTPATGSSLAGSGITLRWRRSKDLTPGDVVTYSVMVSRVTPPTVVFSTATTDTSVVIPGALSGGTAYQWIVTATDLAGHARPAQEPFLFTTTGSPDVAPVVTTPASVAGTEGEHLSFVVSASDPDGTPIGSLSAAPLPPGASFTPNEAYSLGTLQWTPAYEQAGSVTVTFTATNTLVGSATTNISVANVDRAPVLTAPPEISGPAGALLSFAVSASDPDGQAIDSLVLDLGPLPAGHDAVFAVEPGNAAGSFTWHPAPPDTGAYALPLRAGNALVAESVVTVHVSPGLTLAVASYAAGTVGAAFEITATATDPDTTKVLTISVSGSPATLTLSHAPGITPATAILSGTFTEADAVSSPHAISWQVEDGTGVVVSTTTTLHVSTVTAVESEQAAGAPRVVSLRSRPNPFQTSTSIDLQVAGRAPRGAWAVRLYDLHGRLVRTLLANAPWRSTVVRWDGVTESGSRAAAGVYYYRLEGPDLLAGRRLLLLK